MSDVTSALMTDETGKLIAEQIDQLGDVFGDWSYKYCAGSANSIFRGKYLGDKVTDDQYADIKAGTFRLVRLGDYWTIGGINYRVAGCDTHYRTGDNASLGHHVIVVPDTCMLASGTAWMQDTDTTDGGYVGSKMYKTTLATVLTTLQSAFGSKLLTHREVLCNAISDGKPSSWSWYDRQVDLMNEHMVYGGGVWGHETYDAGVENTQLPLFALAPEYIHTRENYWLRDVVSASSFAGVVGSGDANAASASTTWHGVRPFFLLG